MNRADAIDVEAAAALWAVRRSEGLSEAQQDDLDAWLARDSRHLGALVRAEAVWTDLDRVAALSGRPDRRPERSPRRPAWAPASLAAGLVVALLGAGVAHDHLTGRYVADLGEVRRIALEDGSTMMLNSGSIARVRYEAGERRIELRRGEASFEVAHDADRPFTVRAGDLRVRAVGTEFVVRLEPRQVSVTVSEGVVEVNRPDEGPEARRRIGERDQIIATNSSPLAAHRLAEDEVARQLAWRDGLLVFDGEPLGDAAAEVNRYAGLPVVIDDPDLRGETFVGVFRLGDSRAFAAAVAATFDAHVSERSGTLHVSRAEKRSAE